MAGTEAAFGLLTNGSIIKAGFKAYDYSIGHFLWPVLFIWTLIIIQIKTENPAYILFYSILGNFLLGSYLLPDTANIFYLTLVISLALVLWKIYGSKKTE